VRFAGEDLPLRLARGPHFYLTDFRMAALIVTRMRKPQAKRPRNIAGPRIRSARLSLRPPLSQISLVKQMIRHGFKFDASILCRIEKQERGITDLELKTLAKCLKTTIGWLCRERGARP
jgi:hypothetical protein